MAYIEKTRWAVIGPLLDQLLDVDAHVQAARLEEIRCEDRPLANELEALLARQLRADHDGFLSGSLPQDLIGLADAADLTGQVIGGYTLDQPLGQGGMGSVWLATRSDGRYEGKAAVKFLNLALMARGGAERFQREGSFLARLSHPHIARLIDAGVINGGQPYLVLEYIEGEQIDRWCDAKMLGIEARVGLFLDVLAAVAHAHNHLILHRDLKPSNILVTGAGDVKLLDFGIAKLLSDEASVAPATELTRLAGGAFTPEYAAPEQVQGLDVSTATDVYSLGVLLFKLLSGQHPTAVNTNTPVEQLQAIIATEPARLSDSVTRDSAPATVKLVRALRGDLDNIVAKALKKNPQERYANAAAMAEDLRRYLNHEPVTARTDSLAYRTKKFMRRHRLGVTAGAAIVCVLIAGVAGTLWQAHLAAEHAARAEQQAMQAQRERDRALRELTYAEAANEFINFLLGEGAGRPFTTVELLARAEQLVSKQFARDATLRARLQLMIGSAYGVAADANKAQTILEAARVSAAETDDVSVRALVDCTLANVKTDDGDLANARTLFSSAIERLRAEPAPDSAALAACLAMRGEFEGIQQDGKAALASGVEALRQLGTPRPGQRTLAVDARTTLAEGYGRTGQLAQSIQEYEQAKSELDAMGRGSTARASVLLNNLAEKYSSAGRFLQAQRAFQQALEISAAIDGDANVSPMVEGNYAGSLYDIGRLEEATYRFDHALNMSEQRGQKLWNAFIRVMGASAFCGAGDVARCKSWLTAGREGLQPILPPDHYAFGIIEGNAARLALAQGAPERARDHLLRALKIMEATPQRRTGRVVLLSLLARTEQRLGDNVSALRYADRAVLLARSLDNGFEQNAWMGTALLARGIVLSAQGDNVEARSVLTHAYSNLAVSAGESAPATVETRSLLAKLSVL